jgi:hypothetical protein
VGIIIHDLDLLEVDALDHLAGYVAKEYLRLALGEGEARRFAVGGADGFGGGFAGSR